MTTLKEKVFCRITGDFQILSQIVIKQIHFTLQLIHDNSNDEIYTEMNNNERIIDSLEVKIRNEVINTIVLYNPKATDLRMIISFYDMTAYLERVGDLLLNIAGFLKKTATQEFLFKEYKETLLKMLELTENMVQNAIFAFTCEDSKLAKDTIDKDDIIDALHHEIGNNLKNSCSGNILTEQQVADVISISSISYNIERIGDNATNIAEAAIYLMEGKNIKHTSGFPTDAELLQAGSEG